MKKGIIICFFLLSLCLLYSTGEKVSVQQYLTAFFGEKSYQMSETDYFINSERLKIAFHTINRNSNIHDKAVFFTEKNGLVNVHLKIENFIFYDANNDIILDHHDVTDLRGYTSVPSGSSDQRYSFGLIFEAYSSSDLYPSEPFYILFDKSLGKFIKYIINWDEM